MRKIKIVVTLVTVTFFTTGCSLFHRTHGELTKRYESATKDSTTSVDTYVAVEGYAFEPERPNSAKPVLAYQLPTSVVEKLVRAFYAKDSTSAVLIKSLASPLSVPRTPNNEEDFLIDNRTAFSKRLVFSIRNKSYFPADRIWKLTININKSTTIPIRFSSSSVLATEFANVDLGKLAFNRKSSFEANLTAGSGVSLSQSNSTNDVTGNQNNSESTNSSTGENQTSGSGSKSQTTGSNTKESKGTNTIENKIGGNVGFKNEFSSNEEVALKQRYVKLTGSVKSHSFSVYQESTSGIDLSGSVVADVDFSPLNSINNSVIAIPTFEFRKLKTGAAFNPINSINTKMIVVTYPNISVDIYANLTFDGVVRRVVAKDNSIAESDDIVTFIGGVSAINRDSILLLSQREMTPNFWQINNSAGLPIEIQTVSLPAPVPLLFRSFDDAQNFILWFKEKKADVLNARGLIGGNIQLRSSIPFTSQSIDATYVFLR